ncbi:hypothetical protein CsSME_00050010 [Camellia sinensis var. sinensis]
MGFAAKSYCSLLCVMVLLPLVCYSQDAYVCSRATYYGSPDCLGTPIGACGFGEYGRTVYDGGVSGVSRLYRNGISCGACYQVIQLKNNLIFLSYLFIDNYRLGAKYHNFALKME